MIRSTSRARVTLALVVGIVLTLGACRAPWSGPHSWPDPKTARAWAAIDRDLSALGPEVGLVAARVSPDGSCRPVHEVAASTRRPTASQFKLWVLAALANEIAAGRMSWSQTLTVQDSVKSLGNGPGSLQYAPAGTVVSLEEVATKMISISDNTAADMLIGLLGRDAVEAQARRFTGSTVNEPFLTTMEMFKLHFVLGLADQYLATPQSQRDAFLTASVDSLPLSAIASGVSLDPRFVKDIEWFASPKEICRTFAGLQQLSKKPSLSPLATILALQPGGNGPSGPKWPTAWYKGGSEAGVLTLGWLATNRHGQTFVVEAMVTNPDAVLSATSITDLVAISNRAFDLLSPR